MLIALLLLSLLRHSLAVGNSLSRYIQQGECTPTSSCILSCDKGNKMYDLTDVATTGTGTMQRYYQQTEKSSVYKDVVFIYAWSIPSCGLLPSDPNFPLGYTGKTPSFSSSSVWQFSVTSKVDYYLGIYVATSWTYGTINGQFTLSYKTTNGQGPCPNGVYRNTQFFCSAMLRTAQTIHIYFIEMK